MTLVAFDANTCIWGIKKQFTAGQEDNVTRAVNLIDKLSSRDIYVLLPNPVVSELLSPIEAYEDQMREYGRLAETFAIGTFDNRASLELARILSYHIVEKNKAYQNVGISKRCMKYDAYIIAIALANNAEGIYSEDKDFKFIAQDFIEILSLDDLPKSHRSNQLTIM